VSKLRDLGSLCHGVAGVAFRPLVLCRACVQSPRRSLGASAVAWRRWPLASRREEASTQRERQRRQRVFADSFCVLFFGGGPWRPVAFVAVRPPVLFPCAGGQRGCRGVAHPKILGCTPPGHGDGAGGRNRPRNFSTPRREGPRSAAEWSSPWKRSFCASRQDRNKTVSCRGHRHPLAMCVHADRPSGPLAQHAFGQFRYEGVARGAGDPRRDRRRRLRFGVKLLKRQDVVRRVLSTVGSCRRIVCDSYPKRVFG